MVQKEEDKHKEENKHNSTSIHFTTPSFMAPTLGQS